VAEGTPNELKDKLGGDVVTLKTPAAAPDMSEVLRPIAGVSSITRQGDSYRIKCTSGETLVPLAVEACYRAGAAVTGVIVKRPSLDEVFLEFTGREYREEEGPTATDKAVMMQRVRGAMQGRR
jgi:ABC-2 type transport system ATP-binding protein